MMRQNKLQPKTKGKTKMYQADQNAKQQACGQVIGQGQSYTPKRTISFREVGNGWLVECYNGGGLVGAYDHQANNSYVAKTINDAFEIALEKFFEKAGTTD